MPPEPPIDAPPPEHKSDTREHVWLDADGHPRPALPPERAELEPEQRGEDDRLQPPGVRWPVLAALAGGMMAFLAAALLALFLYFHSQVGRQDAPGFARFPDPRLETNIDPRTWPAVQRGMVQVRAPVVPEPSPAILQAAFKMVLARGPHAYDALPNPRAPNPRAPDPRAPGPQPQGTPGPDAPIQAVQATPPPPTPAVEDGR